MNGQGRIRRAACVLTAAMLAQGCAMVSSNTATSAPEPAPTVSSAQKAAPKSTTVPKAKVETKTSATAPAPKSRSSVMETEGPAALDLTVTYLVRLMVPPGSQLTVAARGPGEPVTKTITTKGGPPYAVSLPLAGTGGYPVTITATLTSGIGHVLEGNVTLPKAPGGEVEIVMSPKSAS